MFSCVVGEDFVEDLQVGDVITFQNTKCEVYEIRDLDSYNFFGEREYQLILLRK